MQIAKKKYNNTRLLCTTGNDAVGCYAPGTRASLVPRFVRQTFRDQSAAAVAIVATAAAPSALSSHSLLVLDPR